MCGCSFLLQLSILDLDFSCHAPSLVASAVLCEAFATFGKQPWPETIASYTGYSLEELQPVRPRLPARPDAYLGPLLPAHHQM